MSIGRGTKPICKVCQKQWSRYTCPQCNLQYCSVDCYKKHGDRCTETFYREHATEHLQSLQPSESEKQHMLQILQRLQRQSGQDEAEPAEAASDTADETDFGLSEDMQQKLSMAENVEDIDIAEDDLSPAELQAFKHAIASGQLSKFVDVWVPWWHLAEAATVQLSAAGTSKVSVQIEDAGDPVQVSGPLPAAPSSPLPLVASLTRATPSPLLQWQLLDILYSYCFVMRLYNGDYRSDAQEAMLSMLQVSSILRSSASQAASRIRQKQKQQANTALTSAMPGTASEALLQCIQHACSPASADAMSRASAVGLLQDVATLVKIGRSVVVLALHDLQRLVSASQSSFEQHSRPTAITAADTISSPSTAVQPMHKQSSLQHHSKLGRRSSVAKVQAAAVERKLHFLLSFANELSSTSYTDLLEVVAHELQHHNATLEQPPQDSRLDISDPFVKSTVQVQSPLKQPVIQEL